MKNNFSGTGYYLLMFFSLQPILAAFDYFVDGSSMAVNQFFLALLLWDIRKCSNKITPFALMLVLAVWCLMVGVGHFFASENESILGFMGYAAKFLTFYLCAEIAMHRSEIDLDEKQLSIVLVVALIFIFILQILGYILSVEVSDESYEYALVGLTKHPAVTANLLISCLPLALFFALKNSKILLLVATVLLFMTFRRSSWIVLVIFWLGFFYKEIFVNKDFGIFLRLMMVSIPFFYAVELMAPESIVEGVLNRFNELFSGGEKDAVGSGRDVFWTIIVDDFLWRAEPVNYIFGFGAGAISDLLYFRFGLAIGGHNDFLDLFYGYGLPAAIVLSFFYIFSIFFTLTSKSFSDEKLVFLTSIVALVSLSFTTGGVSDVQLVMYAGSLGWLYKRIV